MVKKLMVVLFILLAPWLALGVLAGALAAAGVLTRERGELILEVLRGRVTPEMVEQAGGQPEVGDAEQLQQLAARREELKKQAENLTLLEGQIDARMKTVRAMEADLANRRRDLVNRIEAFDSRRSAWEARREALVKARNAADFQKAVRNFRTMQPRDAARLFYNYDDTLALRFLRELDADTSSAILAQLAKLDAEKNNRELPVGPDKPAEHNRAAILQRELAEPAGTVADTTVGPS